MDSGSAKGFASPIIYVGHEEAKREHPVTADIFDIAQRHGYDTLTAPITNQNFKLRVTRQTLNFSRSYDSDSSVVDPSQPLYDDSELVVQPIESNETDLTPDQFTARCLLTTAGWIDIASPDACVAAISKQIFLQEIQFAGFCGGVNIVIPGPRPRRGLLHHDGLAAYARTIQEALDTGLNLHFQLVLPMNFDIVHEEGYDTADLALSANDTRVPSNLRPWKATAESMNSWDVWNTVRTVCRYNPRLSLALTVPHNLPSVEVQSRWLAEPVRILRLPGSSFVSNKLGTDVRLTNAQRLFLARCLRLRNPPWILLSGVNPLFEKQHATSPEPTPAEAANGVPRSAKSASHIDYIRQHVQSKQPSKTYTELEGVGYEDYLQNPLQPLAQDLESMTYETFEKCPVKYERYEQAIAAALLDWKPLQKRPSGPEGKIVVAVLGAGRGPLVSRAISASASTGISIDLWAVEKNPSAFIILQRQNKTIWDNQVHLVRSDMRSWSGPSWLDGRSHRPSAVPGSSPGGNIDIIVSELLGSFGDNELSPECIDGAQHLLSQPYGISIPRSYSAHMTPIMAPKLHCDIAARTIGDFQAWNIPYVVMLQAFDYLSVQSELDATSERGQIDPNDHATRTRSHTPVILQAWGFSHPSVPQLEERKTQNNAHNSRFARLSFQCPTRGVCHGLAGYFEAVLYDSKGSHPSEHVLSAVGGDASAPRSPNGDSTHRATMPIEISTNPLNMAQKSQDMISWFPMFFPLKSPLYVPDNSELHVSIWRQTDGRKVWYEWMVELFLRTHHRESDSDNIIKIGMTDIHSSSKDGCVL